MAQIDQEKLNTAAELLRAIAHPLRMSILAFIDKNKTINVNKIYNTLKLEQSITSQHLRILRNVDLVRAERDGKFIHYSVNYEKIRWVNNCINDFMRVNDNDTDTDTDKEGDEQLPSGNQGQG